MSAKLANVIQPEPSSGTHANDTIYTSPETFHAREQRWQQACAKNSYLSGGVHGVFQHKSGVLYCFVPKAGCTFWKQVFNYVNADAKAKEKYKTPWNYPRMFVHNNRAAKGRRFNQQEDQVKYPMRVLVTRDPFSRLLSSYLDKFYLPDFWLVLGFSLKAKDVRHADLPLTGFFKEHYMQMDEMFKQTYKNGKPKDCGSHLTFDQFLRNGMDVYEPHWLPVHKICNPCMLKPTHVVTMETFTSDARVIMKKMGIDHFLDGFDPVQQTDTEIETIVNYNFDKIFVDKTRYRYAGCISAEELAYRLWNNFKWRGYIHPNFDYIIPAPGKNVKEDLWTQLAVARKAAVKDPKACKEYKREFKIQAYRSLNKDLFEKVVKRFETDTLLFGHEKMVEKMRHLFT